MQFRTNSVELIVTICCNCNPINDMKKNRRTSVSNNNTQVSDTPWAVNVDSNFIGKPIFTTVQTYFFNTICDNMMKNKNKHQPLV